MNETDQLIETSARLAAAAAALEQAIARLDAQQNDLCARVERISATVDETRTLLSSDDRAQLQSQLADLQRANADLEHSNTELRAESARSLRKTLPPLVTALLTKSGVDPQPQLDPAVLDRALATLSAEQRIAVKAEMARAGLIE